MKIFLVALFVAALVFIFFYVSKKNSETPSKEGVNFENIDCASCSNVLCNKQNKNDCINKGDNNEK